MVPDGRGLEGWVEKVKGLRSTNQYLQTSHGDVQYGIGNIVNNIVITMCAIRWVLDSFGVTT